MNERRSASELLGDRSLSSRPRIQTCAKTRPHPIESKSDPAFDSARDKSRDSRVAAKRERIRTPSSIRARLTAAARLLSRAITKFGPRETAFRSASADR